MRWSALRRAPLQLGATGRRSRCAAAARQAGLEGGCRSGAGRLLRSAEAHGGAPARPATCRRRGDACGAAVPPGMAAARSTIGSNDPAYRGGLVPAAAPLFTDAPAQAMAAVRRAAPPLRARAQAHRSARRVHHVRRVLCFLLHRGARRRLLGARGAQPRLDARERQPRRPGRGEAPGGLRGGRRLALPFAIQLRGELPQGHQPDGRHQGAAAPRPVGGRPAIRRLHFPRKRARRMSARRTSTCRPWKREPSAAN